MEKEKIYTFEEIKKDILKNDNLNYNIIYMENTYCLLLKDNKYYYIQQDYFGGLTITLYNKIDANTKRQADYSKELYNYNDLLNYITKTSKKDYKPLKNTYNQTIFYDLLTIKNNITLYNYLKNIAGYREKYILNNLNYIKETQKGTKYHILYFYDNNNNYFAINTKDWERLIIN